MKSKTGSKARIVNWTWAIAWGLGILGAPAFAAEDLGVFERVLETSAPFDATAAAFEGALAGSTSFVLHGKFDLTLPDPAQRARVYLLTEPRYVDAASGEPPQTASAQILRVAVYEFGAGKPTQIDMTNPVAHAMVFYAGSSHYDALLAAARGVDDDMRALLANVPGKQVSVQLAPRRSEDALNHFQGDGMARMMAKWRNWKESQLTLFTDQPANFAASIARIEQALHASRDGGVDDPSGWRSVAEIPIGTNAVVFGVTNAFTEATSVRINSGSRSGEKAKDAPYPGVDHAPALPLEILVVNDGKQVRAVQYGQMWRMQLYFWDSGYLAFAGNSGVPGTLFDSIAAMVASTDHSASGSGAGR